MKILVYNHKGGTGKTLISTQLALFYKITLVDLDKSGQLENSVESVNVLNFKKNERIPEISESVVYDTGAYFDDRIYDIKNIDIIIIPFNPTINPLGTTIDAFKKVNNLNIPILFISNRYLDVNDSLGAKNYLEEHLEQEIVMKTLSSSKALQTAENNEHSVIHLFKQGGFNKHIYKKIATELLEIVEVIDDVVEDNQNA